MYVGFLPSSLKGSSSRQQGWSHKRLCQIVANIVAYPGSGKYSITTSILLSEGQIREKNRLQNRLQNRLPHEVDAAGIHYMQAGMSSSRQQEYMLHTCREKK